MRMPVKCFVCGKKEFDLGNLRKILGRIMVCCPTHWNYLEDGGCIVYQCVGIKA